MTCLIWGIRNGIRELGSRILLEVMLLFACLLHDTRYHDILRKSFSKARAQPAAQGRQGWVQTIILKQSLITTYYIILYHSSTSNLFIVFLRPSRLVNPLLLLFLPFPLSSLAFSILYSSFSLFHGGSDSFCWLFGTLGIFVT